MITLNIPSPILALSPLPLLPLPSLLYHSCPFIIRCGEDARKKQREHHLENGYISRAHEEEDTKQGEYDRVNQTKELHHHVVLFTEWVLPLSTHKVWMFHSHCIRFLREEKYQPPDYELKPGAPAPDTVCIKDFICWYIDLSAGCGRVSKNKKPTVRSTCTFAERFFSGFKNATTSKMYKKIRVRYTQYACFHSTYCPC